MKIKNWHKLQHFKDRRPPWIKLYRDILDDPDWHSLSGDDAKILMMIWLIASEDEKQEGNIPDVRKLSFRLRVKEDVLNKALSRLSHWLISDDINEISEVYQHDTPETETETETEKTLVTSKLVDDCPHQKIIDAYHEIVPELPQVKVLTDKRKNLLKARWREDEKRQDIEFWRRFFSYVRTSDFLMGKTTSGWQANFEWLINSTNFVKVIEGNYDKR